MYGRTTYVYSDRYTVHVSLLSKAKLGHPAGSKRHICATSTDGIVRRWYVAVYPSREWVYAVRLYMYCPLAQRGA